VLVRLAMVGSVGIVERESFTSTVSVRVSPAACPHPDR
jgi:hypothetical protein